MLSLYQVVGRCGRPTPEAALQPIFHSPYSTTTCYSITPKLFHPSSLVRVLAASSPYHHHSITQTTWPTQHPNLLYSTLSDFVVDDCINTAKLTQVVHPKMLRSIAQGTVAYDYENGTIIDGDYYGDHLSGTYMVSVAIEGRKGSFLNASS